MLLAYAEYILENRYARLTAGWFFMLIVVVVLSPWHLNVSTGVGVCTAGFGLLVRFLTIPMVRQPKAQVIVGDLALCLSAALLMFDMFHGLGHIFINAAFIGEVAGIAWVLGFNDKDLGSSLAPN